MCFFCSFTLCLLDFMRNITNFFGGDNSIRHQQQTVFILKELTEVPTFYTEGSCSCGGGVRVALRLLGT